MANILLVTNTAGGVSDGAQAVGTILDGQGHTVTVRDDGDAVDSTGFDLVVLWDGSFSTGWAIEAVPIVASDNDVATALGLASSSSVGTGQTAINVIDAGHPIAVAAGLQAGLNTVSTGSSACRLNPGAAAPGVAKIARDSTSTDDRIILAAIDQGGLLIDGETPAPARRVFFGQNNAENWTQLGEDLFLACCDWVMDITESNSQFARPVSIVAAGNWSDQDGSTDSEDLLAAISEEVQDDETYVKSGPNPDGDVFEIELEAIGYPDEGEQVLRYTIGKDVDTGTSVDILVELLDSEGDPVDSWEHTDVSVGLALVEQTLETPLSAGTYRVRFTATENAA